MKLLIGTHNQGKINEFKAMLTGFEIVTPNEIELKQPFQEPNESGKNYFENALIKAKAYFQAFGLPTLVDDSGLEIDALDGKPGVESARFGSENLDYPTRFQLIYQTLEGKLPAPAHFKCVLIFYDGETTFEALGQVDGFIINPPRGHMGFGYDPIFFLNEFQKTMAELSTDIKNKISHRAKAVEAMLPRLNHYFSLKSHIEKLESTIVTKAKEIYQTQDVAIVQRLSGGMSNYTYVISVNGKKKVFRLPGEQAEKFVDRQIEKANLAIVEQITNVPKCEYFDVESGIKITPYVEGVSLHLVNELDYEGIASALKELHNSKKMAVNDYDPFGRIETYEGYCTKIGYQHSSYYYEVKAKMFSYRNYLENLPKVFCHGDAQRSNFVQTSKGVLLVDHEFCGNNDLFYDIACVGNREQPTGLHLLEVYLGRKPTQDELKRFYLWHASQALQWYNVAIYKHLIGIGKMLGFDFEQVAMFYLHNCDETLAKVA